MKEHEIVKQEVELAIKVAKASDIGQGQDLNTFLKGWLMSALEEEMKEPGRMEKKHHKD